MVYRNGREHLTCGLAMLAAALSVAGGGCIRSGFGGMSEPDVSRPGDIAGAVCGNGVVEEGEACDDGNSSPVDGCSGACAVEWTWLCGGSPSLCVADDEVFRSVGPGRTTPLNDGSPDPMEIVGSVATFATDLPDLVGVGDVIQYEEDGVTPALAFVHGRASARVLLVRTAAGTEPAATGGAQVSWSIFRAYTSLAEAAGALENPGIAGELRDFDTGTGGRDLTARGQVWNIACYADAVDTSPVELTGWVTAPDTYVRVYAPSAPSEVGVSQRHSGTLLAATTNTREATTPSSPTYLATTPRPPRPSVARRWRFATRTAATITWLRPR